MVLSRRDGKEPVPLPHCGVSPAMGILTVGRLKPFQYEGQRRHKHAEEGIRLHRHVDTLLVIPTSTAGNRR